MFNLRKQASPQDKMLWEQTEEFKLSNDGLSVINKQLADNHKDDDSLSTTEAQMESGRKAAKTEILEEQLNTATSKLYNHRSQKAAEQPIKPLDLLNQAQENEKIKAWRKAEKIDGNTSFWDDYIATSTKMINKMGPSQLQNNPDRFVSLKSQMTDENVNKNLKGYEGKDNIKEMVMASLRDADATLFSIYYEAATSNRKLNADEQKFIKSVTADKVSILQNSGEEKYAMDGMLGNNPTAELGGMGVEQNPDQLLAQVEDAERHMKQAEQDGDHDRLEEYHIKHQDLIAQARAVIGA